MAQELTVVKRILQHLETVFHLGKYVLTHVPILPPNCVIPRGQPNALGGGERKAAEFPSSILCPSSWGNI
jgi:hypothetical protein